MGRKEIDLQINLPSLLVQVVHPNSSSCETASSKVVEGAFMLRNVMWRRRLTRRCRLRRGRRSRRRTNPPKMVETEEKEDEPAKSKKSSSPSKDGVQDEGGKKSSWQRRAEELEINCRDAF